VSGTRFLRYALARFGMLVLVIVLAATINFVIPRLTPGDPIETKLGQLQATSGGNIDVTQMIASYRERFGLDQPLWRQYLSYWGDLARFDLGYSLENFPDRVGPSIMAALPWTLGLVGISTLIAFTIGTVLGALVVWPRAPRAIAGLVPVFMVLSAIPYFLLGIVLVFTFAIVLNVFPAGGGAPFGSILRRDLQSLQAIVHHAALPALSIILASIGTWALSMRGMMIGVLGEDYITLAEAKGLPPRRIFLWYGLRTALLPQITTLALVLGTIMSGTILVEVLFSYPGLGLKLYHAIQSKDFFMIQGIVMLIVFTIAVTLFVLDLIYPLIDPRIGQARR
jgi:peptide/nickel transport system permease protein